MAAEQATSTGTPGPPAAPTGSPDDGLPVWPLVVAATLIIAGGAWWAVRRQT